MGEIPPTYGGRFRFMPPSNSGLIHDLDSPWPPFLDWLDEDPRSAMEGLHVFAWKLFAARPPSILGRLSREERQDRIAELVMSCSVDDFRRLREYRDIGRSFAGWLATVLVRQVLDWLRKQKRFVEVDEPPEIPAPERETVGIAGRIRDCVHRCLGKMPEKCRLYLACLADGMKPRDIVLLLRLPEGDNKKVSDDLRHCTRKLREMLLAEGVNPAEVSA